MAVIAIITARDMRWVLACCNDAVVAGAASANYLGVVHRVSWNPDVGVMAVFANFRSQNMRRVFAGRINAVVAACAVAGDPCVIEIRGQPAGGRMAVITIIIARDMSWMLAGRCSAVMARATSTDDLCVVDCFGGREYVCIVTILANVGRL